MSRMILLTVTFLYSCMYMQIARAENSDVLYVRITQTPAVVSVVATLGSKQKRFRVPHPANSVHTDFKTLWTKLDEWEVTAQDVAQLNRYEEGLLRPMAHLLDQAEQIHFVLDQTTIDYALGLIPYKNKPLFLQYPISYSLNDVSVTADGFYSASWRGLSIADPTADPDSASALLPEFFPKSRSYQMADVSLSQFKAFKKQDVLLLSLHGVRDQLNGAMDFNAATLTDRDLKHLGAQLIYLDSCQIGSAYNFIQTLRAYDNRFLIAPLFSNEAGDSSSATIQGFFSQLKLGHSPARAMYQVRRQLFERYRKSDGVNAAYWKAFPFRVYQQL